jgi:hypothetical protein
MLLLQLQDIVSSFIPWAYTLQELAMKELAHFISTIFRMVMAFYYRRSPVSSIRTPAAVPH